MTKIAPGLIQQPQTVRHGRADRGMDVPRGVQPRHGRFGRMFPYLDPRPPGAHPTAEELGSARGPMDSGVRMLPNPEITAGFTFLGQFIDHDISFDPTSSLERFVDPAALENFRTPAFELDSLYGTGPEDQPFMYSPEGEFLLGPDGFDLQRNSVGTAIIPDPRNDENLVISQLHLAFLRFHNRVLQDLGDFRSAQRFVRWHYQWIIVHHYLPRIVGGDILESVLTEGLQLFHWSGPHPFTPIEFSAAAFRLGHSQVRPAYRINPDFAAQVFSRSQNDLRGGRTVPGERRIDWSNFFDGLGGIPQPSMQIDTKISGPLLTLPEDMVHSQDPLARSLAFRNLQRGVVLGLPSGQDVARQMEEDVLNDNELWEEIRESVSIPKGASAPLWFYILREAELREDGLRLGRVGGRIVAEVFIGLLKGDHESYLSKHPKWTPKNGDFTMAQLLKAAGVA